MTINQKIEKIEKKLDYLQSRQKDFQSYIDKLIKELQVLKTEIHYSDNLENAAKTTNLESLISIENKVVHVEKKQVIPKESISSKLSKEFKIDWKIKDDFEKFVGTNLINKIGILILIFGVIVGAKYAIDKDLISPLARIIIGYFISLSLLATSMKLKAKYESFSAVLLSGSLATLYFLSFIAYSFYGFISQPITFLLMLVFTVFAVIASISYNKQVIALIGLVGSYAIPFLLSTGSNNFIFLFSYMTIVNIGILVLSFKKYWKLLYYSAFVFTWLIFGAWFYDNYYNSEYFSVLIIFATIFYLTFYITFLAYKLLRKEKFVKTDIIFILLNSFIYYSVGYSAFSENEIAKDYLGLFTVLNALVHFVVSKIIFKQKNKNKSKDESEDKSLFYLATIMVLVFISMAIPVQLDGSWVTLFWALEAALLFWIGKAKKINFYENISYPLMVLAFFSMFQDWNSYHYNLIAPFFNITFLTAIIVSIAFGFITKILYDKKYVREANNINSKSIAKQFKDFFVYIAPAMFLIILYFSFFYEIVRYFDLIFEQSHIDGDDYRYNYDISKFESLWLMFYTAIFASILSFINFKYIKNNLIHKFSLLANSFILFVLLSAGLMLCSELRFHYLYDTASSEYYKKGIEYLLIRYINYAFIALLTFIIYKQIKTRFNNKKNLQILSLGRHIVILWVLSSELLHWMDFNGMKNAYKIALTILWASYSLFAVALGIWKKQKYLRIGAIALFTLTLVKLLLYDLAHLSTIHKTIVLITVGILLLVISFLYNKYANVMDENKIEE